MGDTEEVNSATENITVKICTHPPPQQPSVAVEAGICVALGETKWFLQKY